MRKVNLRDIPDETWSSPKGKFGGTSKEISVALGSKPQSMDLKERHPFDVELCRLPPGKIDSLKGIAIIRFADGQTRRAELHWYEAHGIGRKEFKRKRYLD